MPIEYKNIPDARWGLGLALILGIIHGLLYVFIVPLWQHYDEPNHFEYSWLIASRGKLPAPDDVDFDLRRRMASSMIENEFYRDLGFLPDLASNTIPAWIGPISQLTNPPLYYLISSFAIRMTLRQDIRVQVYAARLISLLCYLACIWAGWGVTSEIARDNSILRTMVPVTITLLPGFADSMSAVNNDALAIALVSLCLWFCVRMVLRGLTLFLLLCGASTAILSLFAKETGAIAVPLFLSALTLSLFRGRYRRLAWSIIGLGFLVVGAAAFSWGDAAGWYRASSQGIHSRVINSSAVLGEYVFAVDAGAQLPQRG